MLAQKPKKKEVFTSTINNCVETKEYVCDTSKSALSKLSASPFLGSLNKEDTASHDSFSMRDGIDKVISKLKMAKIQKEEITTQGAKIPFIGQAS